LGRDGASFPCPLAVRRLNRVASDLNVPEKAGNVLPNLRNLPAFLHDVPRLLQDVLEIGFTVEDFLQNVLDKVFKRERDRRDVLDRARNVLEIGWNVLGTGWNVLEIGWNVLEIGWNVLEIGWNVLGTGCNALGTGQS